MREKAVSNELSFTVKNLVRTFFFFFQLIEVIKDIVEMSLIKNMTEIVIVIIVRVERHQLDVGTNL